MGKVFDKLLNRKYWLCELKVKFVNSAGDIDTQMAVKIQIQKRGIWIKMMVMYVLWFIFQIQTN